MDIDDAIYISGRLHKELVQAGFTGLLMTETGKFRIGS
jgi:hypothetical protein